MFSVPQLPCYKIYKQSNHAMRIIWFENDTCMNHFEKECVGDFLIEFLEMDLCAFQKAMGSFVKDDSLNFDLQFELGYRSICDKMRNAADLLSSNLHLSRFIKAELERCFAKEEWSDPEQLKQGFMVLANVLLLREDFGYGMAFCLDDSLHPEMSIARKFSAFLQAEPKFQNYTFQTGYAMAPVDKKGNLNYNTVRSVNDTDADLEAQLGILQNTKGGVSLLPFTWILSFDDLLFYDFLELVSQGLKVKRCKFCNRYFVLKSKHNAEYCDRKTENSRTCKQVGPKRIFNEQLEKAENAPLKEYDRIRKLKQQQLERDKNKETGKDVGKAQAAFDEWSRSAIALREQFVAGNITVEQFMVEMDRWLPTAASEESNP